MHTSRPNLEQDAAPMTKLRTWLVPSISAVILMPSGFAVAQVVSSSDATTPTASAAAVSTTAGSEDPAAPPPGGHILAPPGEAPPGYMLYGDCPEVLAFYQRPEVAKSYAVQVGRPFGPKDGFKGDVCPAVSALEQQFAGGLTGAGSAK